MSKKILIIDDNPDICLVVRELLQKEVYEVLIATNGKEGLKIASSHKPDLILLDITMPKMDGFAVLSELKKAPKTLSIPVVMLTARTGDESKIKAVSSYCEDYLVKPVTTQALKTKIAEVFARLREA